MTTYLSSEFFAAKLDQGADEGGGVSVPDDAEVLSELWEDNEISEESEEGVSDRDSMGELGALDRTAASNRDIVYKNSGRGIFQRKDGYMVIKRRELRSRD